MKPQVFGSCSNAKMYSYDRQNVGKWAADLSQGNKVQQCVDKYLVQ